MHLFYKHIFRKYPPLIYSTLDYKQDFAFIRTVIAMNESAIICIVYGVSFLPASSRWLIKLCPRKPYVYIVWLWFLAAVVSALLLDT